MLNLTASAALPRLNRSHAAGLRIPDICELLGQVAFESPAKQLGALVDSLGHVDVVDVGVRGEQFRGFWATKEYLQM